MSLMYMARLTRADILMAVTFLASKSKSPTEAHLKHARRILRYIEEMPNIGIIYKYKSGMYLRVYCDASHGLHEDGKGVIGIIIMMGSGYIYAKSGKIKIATLSSTESEGRAMKEAGTYIVWAREMLYFFGYRMEVPTKLFQDNLSAI